MKTISEEKRAAAIAAFENRYWQHGAASNLVYASTFANMAGDVDKDNKNSYEIAARAFLAITGAQFKAKYLGMFDGLTEWGEIENAGTVRGKIPVWRVTIATGSGKMSVRFRGSINDGQNGRIECGVYDVLAALTKSEPGTFDNFANEYGYFPLNSSAEYKRARKTYLACCREWNNICRVWPNEEDRARLAEIA